MKSLFLLVKNVADEASLTTDIKPGARQIITLAPWQLWLARRSPAFASSVEGADAVTIDGRWLNACLKLAGRNFPLVTGRALVQWHFDESNTEKIAVVGSSQAALERVRKTRPEWICFGGEFGTNIDEERLATVLDGIQSNNVSLVFIALGSPKQENWGRKIADLAGVTVIGVGGSIETAVGLRKPPSVVSESLGLEWLQRTFQDPQRFIPRIVQAASIMPQLAFEAVQIRVSSWMR
ncbi:WecB/TagA/CpsF family glycosyltransferase [Arthrobacter sp. MMS24-T111]